ncbi:Uncharacterised protein [Enterobacter kobei]|nr:DUF6685 family protein [Enterobacter kobei]VAL19135.1 Uncharacterised protein [Enterobacter kobei]
MSWLNDGGSHHFGTARYQACRLDIAVPLIGRLCRYGVNVPMITALRQNCHLYAIPAYEIFGSFFDAMNAFECPFGHSELPRNMHDTEKPVLLSDSPGLNEAVSEPVLLLMYSLLQAFRISVNN